MNATSIDELRSAQSSITSISPQTAMPDGDLRMEQIRQLLLGDTLRLNAEKLAQLEARQTEFERSVLQRLDLISQRLDALSQEVVADRRAAFDELARAVHDFGDRVRGV